MAIHHTLGPVQLPSGMIWADEFGWSAVSRGADYSLSGALVIQTSTKQAGRPITLEATDDQGWNGMTREKVMQLQLMANDAEASYPLTLAGGQEFTVAFADSAPISARPLNRHENPPDDWPYVVTLKLMVI